MLGKTVPVSARLTFWKPSERLNFTITHVNSKGRLGTNLVRSSLYISRKFLT
jgi:hypothetical protein